MMRSVLTISLVTIIFFACAEGASRAWLSVYGNALDSTRSILTPDTSLGWRQRSHLSTTFQKLPLSTNELGWRTQSIVSLAPDTKKILILGPSSTFGWGVRAEETYAEHVQSLLGTTTTVLNAGEIGYSSAQGVRLFARPDVQGLNPSVVIIAYGINDLDLHRFYFQSGKTDEEEFRNIKSLSSVRTINILSSSTLLSVLFKTANFLQKLIGRAPTDTSSVRVPLPDFEKNIRTLIKTAKENGGKVILLTTTTHFPAVSALSSTEAREQVRRLTRDIPLYNKALKEIALSENVTVGDIDAWFTGQDREKLFVDPIHFSSQGNEIIAHELQGILKTQRFLE